MWRAENYAAAAYVNKGILFLGIKRLRMTDRQTTYQQASLKTANNLKTVAQSKMLTDLSHLSLPEIDAVVDQVAQLVPAGNVPGVVLTGLARLPGRRAPLNIVQRDINLLFKGVSRALDKAVYGTFFAGPAAVIWGYQNLLKLAGKDPEESFPEGVWQFYVDYALREDTARHVNETHGFDTALNRNELHLNEVDRITAWVMAAINCLHQYNDLLENEWRERVYITLLQEITGNEPESAAYIGLYRTWEKQRPYARGGDVESKETYPQYRRRKFDQFLAEAAANLPEALHEQWRLKVQTAEEEELPAYQQQMSVLASLEPGQNHESRVPLPLGKAQIGVIHQGRYYLIPGLQPSQPPTGRCHTGKDPNCDLGQISLQRPAYLANPTGPPQTNFLARSK